MCAHWQDKLLPGLAVIVCVASIAGCGDSNRSTTGNVTAVAPAQSAAPDTNDELLSERMRKHVWDIEHFGFVIEATVFTRLKSNLNDGRLDYWADTLTQDCRTAVVDINSSQPISFATRTGATVAATADADQPLNNDRKTFLAWLATVREPYEKCTSSLGLVRLTPKDEDLNGTWNSIWRLRMSGHSESDQPLETVIDFDVQLTELHDSIAEQTQWIDSIQVVKYRSTKTDRTYFTETSVASGLVNETRHDNWKQKPFVPNTGGIYVTDYDLDGLLDVFVDDTADGNRLYRGNGDGTFTDTTSTSGIDAGESTRTWTLSCWADLDNDGDDDLIVEDKLYQNLGNGHFDDITAKTNFPLTPAVSYAVSDFNVDGLLDVYVCHSGAYRVGQSERTRVKWIDDGLGIDNVLLKNLGDWQFEDVTETTQTGANGSSCFTAVWLHANDDNLPDLFSINEFGVNSLLLNSKTGPFQSQPIDPVFGGFSMGVTSGDVNNDGQTDLYVANMYSKAGNRILANIDRSTYPPELYRKIEEGTRGSKLYVAQTNGRFKTVAADDMFANVGWAYGPTFADFDNDGWLDIYATAGFKSEERGKPDG